MTDYGRTFEEVFGKNQVTARNVEINYERPSDPNFQPLPIPILGDDLMVTSDKMAALASIVSKGLSLAVYTGHRAGRNLAGTEAELRDMERAEKYITEKVVAIASTNVNRDMEKYRILCRRINAAAEKVRARVNAIRSKIPGSRPRRCVANEKREALGLEPIGEIVDYSPMTKGTRGRRTDLLKGTLDTPSKRDREHSPRQNRPALRAKGGDIARE